MKQVNFDTQTLADAIFCEIIAELPTRNLTPEVIRGILDGCVSFVGKQQPTQKNSKSPSIPQSIPSPRSIQPIPPQKKALIGRILKNPPQGVKIPYLRSMEFENILAWAQEYCPIAVK